VNLAIGIIFIVLDFVMAAFPKVAANLAGVRLRTGPSSSRLLTTRELKRGIASKFLFQRKTAVSPTQVAGDIGNMSPEISENNPIPLPPTRFVPMEISTVKPQVEAGCRDNNHDIMERGSDPRDGEDQVIVHGPPTESFTVKTQVEAGCMDHNDDMVDDIVDQGFVRGRDTQWNGKKISYLERSAVALPVIETIPVGKKKTTRKLTSI
jgi:hypothetical protein